jgi:arylformamidase
MLDHAEIFDISPLVSSKIAVFPGDKSFETIEALSFDQGHNLLLSAIHTTVHLGAHADAPNHYHKSGVGIDQRSLHFYLGSAQVISVQVKAGERITPAHLPCEINAPRILFKTNSFPNPDCWNNDFCSLSPELIKFLKSKKVITVGIDTPSVDPETSKKLEAHNEIFKQDLAILEGLILNHIDDGLYQLIALPLKLKDLDASPVRAILLRTKHD